MRMINGQTVAGDRVVWFQVILSDPKDGRFEVVSVTASRVIGKPYQCSKSELASVTRQVLKVVNDGADPETVWQDEIEATDQKTGRRQNMRGASMENTNQKAAKAETKDLGQCHAVPRETAKAEGRCPRRITTENPHGLCGTHLNFVARGSETKLIDGTVLNAKAAPVAEAPKVESKPEPKHAKATKAKKAKAPKADPIIPANPRAVATMPMAARSLPSGN